MLGHARVAAVPPQLPKRAPALPPRVVEEPPPPTLHPEEQEAEADAGDEAESTYYDEADAEGAYYEDEAEAYDGGEAEGAYYDEADGGFYDDADSSASTPTATCSAGSYAAAPPPELPSRRVRPITIHEDMLRSKVLPKRGGISDALAPPEELGLDPEELEAISFAYTDMEPAYATAPTITTPPTASSTNSSSPPRLVSPPAAADSAAAPPPLPVRAPAAPRGRPLSANRSRPAVANLPPATSAPPPAPAPAATPPNMPPRAAVVGPPPRPPAPAVVGPPPMVGGRGRAAATAPAAVAARGRGARGRGAAPAGRGGGGSGSGSGGAAPRLLTNTRFDPLLGILINPDAQLLRALCATIARTEVDIVATSLVNLFAAAGASDELVLTVISHEVSGTDSAGTLFRGNTLPSKVLSVYSMLVAKEYLSKTIAGPISYVTQSNLQWEVNPEKAQEGEDVAANLANVLNLAQVFFESILNSIRFFPPLLRQVCMELRSQVVSRYPNAEYSVIGGFYFLRFLCPAIVSPDGFGIVKDLPPSARRPLVLVSKILQNLANGIEFGGKEHYMVPLNSFLQENTSRLHRFFDELASPAKSAPPAASKMPKVEIEIRSIDRMHLHLYMNIARLKEQLVQQGAQTTVERLTTELPRLGEPVILTEQKKAAAKRKK